MALELQLSTKAAQDALAQLDAKLGTLANAFANFGAADGAIKKIGGAISAIPALNPSVVTGLTALSRAVNSLSKADKLTSLATGLAAVGAVNVGQAAASVQALSNALAQIRIPRNLAGLGQNIAKIGNEAQMGAKGVASFGQALSTIRGATGLNSAASGLSQVSGGARTATASVQGFSSAWSTMSGVLAAAGVQTGVAGLVNFAKGAMDASIAIDQFKIKLDTVSGTAGTGAQAIRYLNEAATRLGLPLETSIDQFGKISAAMLQSGRDMDDVKRVFEGFGTAFRVLGASSAQVARGFTAVAQTFQKGTVSMEELRQQLGEIIPAFGMLADALGTNGAELSKMIANGEISANAFLKLADKMTEKFGPGLKAALLSAQGSLIALENSLFRVQAVAGANIFASLNQGILSFARTLESADMNNFIQGISTLIGLVGQGLAGAFNIVISSFSAITTGVNLIVAGFQGLNSAVSFATGGFVSLSGIAQALGGALAFLASPLAAMAITFYTLNTALSATRAAFEMGRDIFKTFSGTVGSTAAKILGLAAAAVVLGAAGYAAYQWAANGVPFMQTFTGALGSVGGAFRQVVADMTGVNSANQTVNQSFLDVKAATDNAGSGLSTVSQVAGQATNTSGQLVDGFGNASGAATSLADASTQAADGVGAVAAPTQQAADSATQLDTGASGAANSVANLGGNASGAAGSVSSLTGNLSSSAAAADRAAAAYLRAAQAAAAFNSQSGGGNVKIGDIGDVTTYAGGGTTNGPAFRTQPASLSAFVNAPHLASGTANTNSLPGAGGMGAGGIPAVLHPNEAVVPLAGGGAIPVVSNGSGDSSLQAAMFKIAEDTLSGVLDLNDSVGRVWEQVRAQTSMEIGAYKTVNYNLVQLHNDMLSMNEGIVTAIKNIQLSGGSQSTYTGTTSGSPLTGDAAGAVKQFGAQFQDLLRQSYSAQAELKNTEYATPYFKYGTGNGEKFYSPQDQARLDSASDQASAASRAVGDFVRANKDVAILYYQSEISRLSQTNGNESVIKNYEEQIKKLQSNSFATGSPNAFKDATSGGFMATLHPDEAVIPLPDGRSVPVTLPPQVMRAMQERESGERREGSVYIEMTINTPDANSFRASQNQIINDLRAKIDRAANKVGPARRRVEDPTKKIS